MSVEILSVEIGFGRFVQNVDSRRNLKKKQRCFWSLKQEWTNHREYADLEKVRQSLFEYIEMFYNRVRLHQTLGYLSPDPYEAEHTPAAAV